MTDISSTSAPWLRLVLSEEERPTADGGDARNAASTRVHELYQQHSSMLVRQLTRETGCRELARELAHEAFVRLLRLAPAKLVRIERPDAYLRRVSINLLRDWGRQHALSERSRADLQPPGEQVVDQLAALEARDTLRRLERAIASLRPRTRAVFLAQRIEGLSYREIAERTGLSVKGVEKQMAKAIAKIDRFLDRP